MKANTHPTYYDDAKVVCSCGNSFTVGATRPEIHDELCSNCHPLYTGQQKVVDTASRIAKLRKKVEVAKEKPVKEKLQKENQGSDDAPKTLRDMLQALRK